MTDNERREVVRALRELLAHLEAGAELPEGALARLKKLTSK